MFIDALSRILYGLHGHEQRSIILPLALNEKLCPQAAVPLVQTVMILPMS
jgi:hypothetical protein